MSKSFVFLWVIFFLIDCADPKRTALKDKFIGMDSVYAQSLENREYFFLGNLFGAKGQSLLISQGDQMISVFIFKENGLEKGRYSQEMGFIENVKLVDINGDGKNEIIVKAFSGNSPDDQLFVFREDSIFLKNLKYFFADSFVITQNLTDKYIATYQSIGCADLSWKSELLTIVGDSIVKIGKLEFDQCDDPDRKLNIEVRGLNSADTLIWKGVNIKTLGQNGTKSKVYEFWQNILQRHAEL